MNFNKAYGIGVNLWQHICWTSGGGSGQNPTQTCMDAQYGQFVDLNNDGLPDIVWQYNDGTHYTYYTYINNGASRQFDLTYCSTNVAGNCPANSLQPEEAIPLALSTMKRPHNLLRERITIRAYHGGEGFQIAKPTESDFQDFVGDCERYLAIKFPFKIIHEQSGSTLTSLDLVRDGDVLLIEPEKDSQ